MNIYICKTSKQYQTAGNFDDQQHYKAILEVSMVSRPKRCNCNIPITPNQYEFPKNTGAIKQLYQFQGTLDVKRKTSVRRLCVSKANSKATITDNVFQSNIEKSHGNTVIY